MIVAADPLGDFNATSQILRYSALAKEVTVPRVPSTSETILSGDLSRKKRASGQSASARSSPNSEFLEQLEATAAQLAHANSECEALTIRLAQEEIAREHLELRIKAMDGRSLIIEQEAREAAWVEMELQMEEERKRWQRAWTEQVGIVKRLPGVTCRLNNSSGQLY